MSAAPPPSPSSTAARYWRTNLRLLALLLTIWFAVSFGAGILFVDPLDHYRLPGTGFPLGFWFAQQGAIVVFVILIWVYAWRMNRLERDLDLAED